MRRFSTLGAVLSLVMAATVVLLAPPAGAAEWSGSTVTGHPAWEGACNTTYRGLDNPSDGYQVDLACQVAIPAGQWISGLGAIPIPREVSGTKTWGPIGLAGASGDSPSTCPKPDVYDQAELGAVYTLRQNTATGALYGLCGGSTDDHAEDKVVLIVAGYAAGAAYTSSGSSYQAVQFRLLAMFLPGPDGNPLLESTVQTVAEMGSTPLADYWALLHYGVSGYVLRLGGFAAPLEESDLNNTPPVMPADYFTGGSAVDLGPCQLVSWTGPPRDTNWQAGVEYAFVFEWTGAADELSVWSDGSETHVDAPVTGSPQTVLWTAVDTGHYNVFAACESGGSGYSWGAYTNLDLHPGGDETQSCFQSLSIGLNPSSWVPAAGRMVGCLLRVLFIPSGSATDAFSDALDGSVVEAAGGIQATVTGSWAALAESAGDHSAACEGPSFTLPIEPLGNPQVALLSTCTSPASTFAPIVRGFVLFALGLMVLFAVLRGLSRVVGADGAGV